MVWRGDHREYLERDEGHVEQDEFAVDDPGEDYGRRSIFAAGWLRAALLLTAMAAAVAVALPSLLDWFEPATSPVREAVRPVRTPAPTEAPALEPMASNAMVALSRPAPPAATASSNPSTSPAVATRAPLPARAAQPSGTVQTADGPDFIARKPSGATSADGEVRWVQVGIFKEEQNAQRLARTLRAQGFSVAVKGVTRGSGAGQGGIAEGRYYLVRAGAFRDSRGALAARDDLKARGYAAFVAEAVTR